VRAENRFRRRRSVVAAVVLAGVVLVAVAFVATRRAPESRSLPSPKQAAAAANQGPRPEKGQTPFAVTVTPVPLSAPLSRAVAVPRDGGALLLGGLSGRGHTTADVLRLDPASGRTERVGSLAEPTHDAAGAIVGGHVYVFGGGAQKVSDAVQSLDGDGSGPGHVVGRLPTPRADVAAVVVGDRAILVGGYDGRAPLAGVEATTDGIHFDEIARLPVPVRYPAVAAVGERVYVMGGEAAGGDSTVVQVIDPQARTAQVVGRLPRPLAHATATVLGTNVLLVGGRVSGTRSNLITRYDPGTGAVADVGRLPVPLSDAAVAVIGDSAYVVGGEGPDPLASMVVLHDASGVPGQVPTG